VDSPFTTQNSKSSFCLLCFLHTDSNALLAEFLLSQNVQQFCLLSCDSMHLLNALLAELSESSVILVFFKLSAEFLPLCTSVHMLNAHLAELHRTPQRFCLLNSQQSSSNCTLCLCSMPTWQSPYRTPKRFCLQLCFNYTALPPRYSATLRSSSPELLTSVPVPQHVFV
jgi:hypothetical protein